MLFLVALGGKRYVPIGCGASTDVRFPWGLAGRELCRYATLVT
jgi:hypothetical protein